MSNSVQMEEKPPVRERLREVRLQLHWAVQPVSSVGTTFGVPEADYGHTTLSWDSEKRSLVGLRIGPEPGVRFGLNLDAFVLWFLDEGTRLTEDFDLNGETLDSAREWVAGKIRLKSGGDGHPTLRNAGYDLPPHPVAEGSAFSLKDSNALSGLADWYDLAHAVLDQVRRNEPRASAVRCWPHHFDIATLISLEPEASDPETARSIGVGMSPGDGSYDEPYFYVTPWPYPADFNWPELPSNGHWHRTGWTGAVLTASAIELAGENADRSSLVADFLRAAIAACRKAVGFSIED